MFTWFDDGELGRARGECIYTLDDLAKDTSGHIERIADQRYVDRVP